MRTLTPLALVTLGALLASPAQAQERQRPNPWDRMKAMEAFQPWDEACQAVHDRLTTDHAKSA